MDLNTIWFILIAVLYVGFFVLEGFDFGVGILLPFISRDRDKDKVEFKRRIMINAIGPHWDGNEVWLLTAGGATFAAFPHWYATMFSGFYLAFFLLLLALILRGIALEFRSKDPGSRWRRLWDWSIFLGSAVPALLLGVAFGNLATGVPIDANMNFTGTFFTLLNPYTLWAGLAALLLFALHGAIFLCLKTSNEMQELARKAARRLWLPVVVVLLVLLVSTYFATDILATVGVDPGIVPVSGIVAILLTGYFLRVKKDGLAFAMTAISIAVAILTVFLIMYPFVMISTLNPAYSLTIYNASSSTYTLRVMTIVGVIFLPLILAYQAWSYWVFRKRLTIKSELVY
jgi:cytochrome bd ubiquinol oxidase subunit II